MRGIGYFVLVFSILMSFACMVKTVDFELAPPIGFTPEVDEPATRGQLVTVSPSQFFVYYRFAISPDGKSIAFAGTSTKSKESAQIYRMNINGGSPVKITSGGDVDSWSPSFTPDGKFIVFESEGVLWKVRSDGASAKMKIPGSDQNVNQWPQVSIKNKVVFTTTDVFTKKDLIWTVNLDGTELTQYREGSFPSWSPDGEKIAFQYENDIWLMNLDGTQLTQLTTTRNVNEGIPSFSISGDRLIYVSDEGQNNDPNIWTIRVDGTEKTKLTQLKSWDSWPLWGPDGIYFLSGRGMSGERIQRIWKLRIN